MHKIFYGDARNCNVRQVINNARSPVCARALNLSACLIAGRNSQRNTGPRVPFVLPFFFDPPESFDEQLSTCVQRPSCLRIRSIQKFSIVIYLFPFKDELSRMTSYLCDSLFSTCGHVLFFFFLLLLLARYIASLERLGVNSEFRNIHREERERDCADQSDQCR